MAGRRKIGQLAAVGSTGNNTHASVAVNEDVESLAFEFEITAVGGTPTVTFKFQGSQDDPSVADGSSDWFDLMVLPSDSDTGVASAVKTAVGVYEYYLGTDKRDARKVRVVSSANTNVTYEAELYGTDSE